MTEGGLTEEWFDDFYAAVSRFTKLTQYDPGILEYHHVAKEKQMKSYTLNMASTGQVTEIHAVNDAEAIAIVERRYPDWISADQWDADGLNDDDQPCKRLLFWASEEDAESDCGANAVAELQAVGNA